MKLVQITPMIGCLLLLLMTSCSPLEYGQIQNVGLLLEGSIDDNAWNKQGYEGLLQIGEKFDVHIYYEENVVTETDVRHTVNQFVEEGINLIYGHGSIYGSFFQEIEDYYPDVHFVYFNGGYYSDHVTSINFNAHAMGYFSGMIAAKMSSTDKVGIIASFESQPEIEGFYEGASFINPEAEVHVKYINNWKDIEEALEIYQKMRSNGVDVFYPAGNYFSESVIKKAEEDGVYAIGYIANQADLAPRSVLTSTVQHVEQLYTETAEQFHKGTLEGTIITYDFTDGHISLNEFHDAVPESFQDYMNDVVTKYKETGMLPDEQELK